MAAKFDGLTYYEYLPFNDLDRGFEPYKYLIATNSSHIIKTEVVSNGYSPKVVINIVNNRPQVMVGVGMVLLPDEFITLKLSNCNGDTINARLYIEEDFS